MDGRTLLNYSRFRKDDEGDFGRTSSPARGHVRYHASDQGSNQTLYGIRSPRESLSYDRLPMFLSLSY